MTTTNSSTHTCTECGRLKPVTDRFGNRVQVGSYSPPDGGDDLVMISTLDEPGGDKRLNVLLLTIEMADRLVVQLASIAEADRQFKLEAQS